MVNRLLLIALTMLTAGNYIQAADVEPEDTDSMESTAACPVCGRLDCVCDTSTGDKD